MRGVNRQIAAALVVLSIVAGVGVGFAVQRMNDEPAAAGPGGTSTVTPSPSASTGGTSALVAANRNERTGPSWSPADIIKDGKPLTLGNVAPGRIGVVTVGMRAGDAVDTGFIAGSHDIGDECEAPDWLWAEQFSEGFDIYVDSQDMVTSLGMFKDGAETAEGISIGNSYKALKETYGKDLSEVEEGGYAQSTVFLREGDAWLGFLFDEAPDALKDDSRITFIEVTRGIKPGLMRDGC